MADQATTQNETTRFRCSSCNGDLDNFPDEEVSTRWTMPWASIAPSPVLTEDYLLICNDCTLAMMQTNEVNRSLAARKGR
jgi:hypothetical protein